MVSDFGYVNARLRAMKSYLLRRDDYTQILHKDRFDTFFMYLQSLPSYSDDLRAIRDRVGQSKEAIDEGLKNHHERIFRRIINFCSGKPRQLILCILCRYDIYNLKAILRGIFHNLPSARRLNAVICSGEWDRGFCERLSNQNTIDGITDLLAHTENTWSQEMGLLLSQCKKDKIGQLEDKLEIFYFQYALSNLEEKDLNDSQIIEFLRYEIDLKNILSILKSIDQRSPIDRMHLVRGGRIDLNLILEAAQCKNIRDALDNIRKAYHHHILSEPVAIAPKEKTIPGIEKFFRKQLLSKTLELSQRSPLHIGVGLGYWQMKEAEIINLRTLAKGLYYGLSNHILENELILAH